jgi:hypothetical protein
VIASPTQAGRACAAGAAAGDLSQHSAHRRAAHDPFRYETLYRSRTIRRPRIDGPAHAPKDIAMNLHISLQPLIALIAGILILVRPKLLNYVVAFYLIIVGLLGLFPGLRL